jgi:hypothetical protein
MLGGNYAPAGAGDIRRGTRGITPTSDVTVRKTSITNLGRTAAAGVVAGARRGQTCASNAAVRECPASRSRPVSGRASALQGSGGLVRVHGWCRAQLRRRKRGRVGTHLENVCVVPRGEGTPRAHIPLARKYELSAEKRPGGGASTGNKPTTSPGRKRRGREGPSEVRSERYRYGLSNVNFGI